jgi:hypothetical protein
MAVDVNAEERHNVQVLLRWISLFVAFPSLTIAAAFSLWDFQEHALHVAGLLPLGIAAIGLFFLSGRVATKFYPPEIIESGV